jgi:hypothetical protein
MMNVLDTGDTIKTTKTGTVWTVACVIGGRIYKTGYDLVWTMPRFVELVNKASTEYKDEILRILSKLPVGDPRKEYSISEMERLRMEREEANPSVVNDGYSTLYSDLTFKRFEDSSIIRSIGEMSNGEYVAPFSYDKEKGLGIDSSFVKDPKNFQFNADEVRINGELVTGIKNGLFIGKDPMEEFMDSITELINLPKHDRLEENLDGLANGGKVNFPKYYDPCLDHISARNTGILSFEKFKKITIDPNLDRYREFLNTKKNNLEKSISDNKHLLFSVRRKLAELESKDAEA